MKEILKSVGDLGELNSLPSRDCLPALFTTARCGRVKGQNMFYLNESEVREATSSETFTAMDIFTTQFYWVN